MFGLCGVNVDFSFNDCSAMTGDQSRLLKPFDRVCWQNDPADQGTVIEKNWSGVTIKWDSRGLQVILHNDMARVERVQEKIK